MGKKIAWTDPAKADLRAIDQPTALRILHIMARYLATGAPPGRRAARVPSPRWRLPRPLPRSRRLHPGPRRKTPPRSLPLTRVRFFPEVFLEQLAGSLHAFLGHYNRFG